MKRSSFLKALLCIAVAPVAIAKAIEQVDVKPEMVSGEHYFNKLWKEATADDELTWYENEIKETKRRFDESYEKFLSTTYRNTSKLDRVFYPIDRSLLDNPNLLQNHGAILRKPYNIT